MIWKDRALSIRAFSCARTHEIVKFAKIDDSFLVQKVNLSATQADRRQIDGSHGLLVSISLRSRYRFNGLRSFNGQNGWFGWFALLIRAVRRTALISNCLLWNPYHSFKCGNKSLKMIRSITILIVELVKGYRCNNTYDRVLFLRKMGFFN